MASAFPANDPVRDHLVTSNQAFVAKVARAYRNFGLPFEDLMNEGNVGLLEAARRFDPSRGYTFLTYAVWWIRRSILRAVARNATVVRGSDYRNRQASEIHTTGRSLSRRLGRQAEREEICRELRLTIAKMDQILQARVRVLPLDAPSSPSDDRTIMDRLVDDRVASPEAGMIQREDERLLRLALRSLTEQERTILAGRFGLRGVPVQTLEVLGARLGLSRERVRQIEVAAKERLRKVILRDRRATPAARVVRAGRAAAVPAARATAVRAAI
jgi:RNA polymerase sigma factor (sigma-70 family)